MKRDTRQAILDTAKTLFSQRGYNDVSIGEIAGALGISKGNLTYHFKKKEEIMEAILDSLTPTYPNDPPQSLAQLDACLLDMEEARSRNAFYFWNHAQLGQLSAKIKGMQRRIYRHHFHLLTQSFRDLRDQGELSPESYPREYARVADAILLTNIYWLPFSSIKETEASFRPQAWAVLYPHLTRRGREELAGLGIVLDPFDASNTLAPDGPMKNT